MQPSRRRDATRNNQAVTRRHRPDYKIILYMGILMLLGLVIMYAIGPQRANVLNNAYGADYGSMYFFIKQGTSLLLALAAFAFAATISHTIMQKYSAKIFLAGLAACALLAVAGFAGWGLAQCSLGACRWFNLPFGSIQPAEFLKIGLLLFLAGFIGTRAKQGLINDLKKTIYPVAVALAVALFFVIVLQKDMGTGIALTSIATAMMFVAGINKRNGLTALGVMFAAGVLLIVTAPHRIARVATYFSGDVTTESAGGYHIAHAIIAIGSGGPFGVGIGNSVQATGYLPEAINDSVFAIMGETFGFVGLVAILLLFGALLMQLLRIADHLSDMRMRLMVIGVFGWLASHVVLNVAAMIGVFPLTGITLPLLSFGGTSMIFIAAALGLSFQLSRYTTHNAKVKESVHEDTRSRRRVGGTRYASRRRTTSA